MWNLIVRTCTTFIGVDMIVCITSNAGNLKGALHLASGTVYDLINKFRIACQYPSNCHTTVSSELHSNCNIKMHNCKVKTVRKTHTWLKIPFPVRPSMTKPTVRPSIAHAPLIASIWRLLCNHKSECVQLAHLASDK